MLEWAKNEGTPSKAWVEQQTKEFVAWVQAVDKRYVNWEQAWRNSILRAMDRAGSNGSSHGNGNGAAVEEFDADGYALDDMRRGIRRGPQKLDFE